MIICLCHRVSERDIHQAVADGIDNFEDLQGWTRAGTQCGRCRDMAGEVLGEALACPGRCPSAAAPRCGVRSEVASGVLQAAVLQVAAVQLHHVGTPLG